MASRYRNRAHPTELLLLVQAGGRAERECQHSSGPHSPPKFADSVELRPADAGRSREGEGIRK